MAAAHSVPPSGSPDGMRVLRVLFDLARPHRRQFAAIVFFSFLATAADLAQPLIYRDAINDVTGLLTAGGHSAPDALRSLLIVVTLLFLTGAFGYFCSQRSDYLSSVAASRIESTLIVDTFGHVLRLPLSFFARRPGAALAKRIDQSDEVSPVIHAFSQQIAPEVIRLVGICVIMFTQNAEMAVVALGLLPPYLWISRRAALRLRTGLEPYHEMWENISARIVSAVGAVKTVKLSGAEGREQAQLRLESAAAYDIYLGRIRTSQHYYFAQAVLSHLSKSLLLGYGGWLVLQKRLTPGAVIMFAAYLDRLYSPIDSLNAMAVNLQQNIAALARAIALLDEGPVERKGAPVPPGTGRVEFRDVRFSYRPGTEVLRGLTFTVEPGTITAIAGPSGAGKTTTADLLLKLFPPDSGEIFLDGMPLSGASPAAVRSAIGVVAVDGAVFRGTIAANIRYKNPEASDEDVRGAAIAAGLGPVIDALPGGLDTELGDGGTGLSMGERQRLQIARMLAARPRLLVLDEATANLDFQTENEVRRALEQISPRPAMLVIAHRYAMIRTADRVIVLKSGEILEQGTPRELIARGGWFASLAEAGATEPAPAARPASEEDEDEE